MKLSVKSILRFLFPEIQIVDAVKQEGFLAKKQAQINNIRATNNTVVGNTIVGNTVVGNTVMQSSGGSSSAQGSFAPANRTAVPNAEPVSSSTAMSADKVDGKFDGIERQLRNNWIASNSNISALCQAFKRPFVMGVNPAMPKNTILLIGNESRGKVKAIRDICVLLKQKCVFRYDEVPTLGFDGYPTSSEDALFLSDLYKALYSQSEVVVFEHIEKANFRCLDIVFQLIKSGSYRLQKRYVLHNSMLVESTGMLNTASISELSTNGKYFIFTSTRPAEKVMEYVGNEFARLINDIIVLDAFSPSELQEIVDGILASLTAKAKKHLQFDLSVDASCSEAIINCYDTTKGVKGLIDVAEESIYKPLAEYRLEQPAQRHESAILKYEDSYSLYIHDTVISLSSYVKQYDALALESVKRELEGVIGLSSVKEYVLNLENNLTVQKLRAAKGLKAAELSMHMIFTGNPGTGKTTIARIVAKYLKAIGVLSSGQLREVSRSDMVGQYVGQTAKLTTELITSAIGGVLFIDEAYALCRDKYDIFGLEAIDALVKGIEDHRDNLVVILAGYSDEMEEFLKTNPGLKSRFPNVIDFEDYTPDEMYEIAKITARSKGYRISEECRAPMLDVFERKQIKGKNDSGNGRLARNLIEAAILNQSQRIAKDNTQDLELLTVQDFELHQKKLFNLEEELASIIGLESVKDFVRTQYNVILAREKRKKAQLNVDTTQSLNMIFSGNPGTGKTTMARVVADMFHSMGLLKSGHLIETDKGGLIAEYVGQTAKKTEGVFKSALGGVLFIDEAYAITNDGSSFGQECIDTLVKLIEDYRGEILVILAGYSKEMNDFMKANSGLESRFPLNIEFLDYSADELFEIGKNMIAKKGFCLSEDAVLVFKEAIYDLKRHATATSGNGRMVRNFIEEIIRNQSSRIALSEVSAEEMTVILPKDIESETTRETVYDLEAELRKVVGLDSVKKYIRSLNARLMVQEQRKKHGLKVSATQTLHMIFMGNPGTGKTMMARTVANVLFDMGIISTNKLVETDRSGLVAGYVGQTAIKTREVIESALNGVLFIDEAYALAQGGDNDFGQEAIDTLVKMMDDNRDRLVVILAGYYEDMQNFLNQNAGLNSRFPNVIEFEDYSTGELLSIAEKMYKEQGYVLSFEAAGLLEKIFEEGKKQPQFGNGRFVRNIFEKSLNCQAVRLSRSGTISTAELSTITAEDIEEVLA